MKTVEPAVGDVVEVIFDDHILNSDEIHRYTAYGRIHILNDKQITIDSWHPVKDGPRMLKDETECYTLMRSAIYEINVLGDFGDPTPEVKFDEKDDEENPKKDQHRHDASVYG